jgi:hypothetical protein
MLQMPISGIALEGPYGDGFIQFPPAAFKFAGMHAYASAYGRERVPFPDDVHGLLVFPSSYGCNVVGDVNTRRAGVLAGRDDHGITGSTSAPVIEDVFLILFQEVLEGG